MGRTHVRRMIWSARDELSPSHCGRPTPGHYRQRSLASGICGSVTMMVMMASQHEEHDQNWAVADAKARFSEMIDRAISEGPQTITRKGRKAVVVVSTEEWERITRRRGSLADFFAASPLRGSRLEIERPKDGPRDIKL